MNKRKIFNIVVISLSLLMMLDLFLTFENVEGVDHTLWGILSAGGKTIFIMYTIFNLLFCIFDITKIYNKIELCFVSSGFYFTFFLMYMFSYVDAEALPNTRMGFWIGLVLSAFMLTFVFLTSREKIDEVVSDSSKNEPKNNNNNQKKTNTRNTKVNNGNMTPPNYRFNRNGPYSNNGANPNQGMMYPNNYRR